VPPADEIAARPRAEEKGVNVGKNGRSWNSNRTIRVHTYFRCISGVVGIFSNVLYCVMEMERVCVRLMHHYRLCFMFILCRDAYSAIILLFLCAMYVYLSQIRWN
jgi:hypothetical protein